MTKAAAKPVENNQRRAQLERLQAERERQRRAAEPRALPDPSARWLPTPSQGEADLTSRPTGYSVTSKVADLSPVDPASFDPTPGPALPPPPVNTATPFVTPLTGGLEVGETLVASVGSWTGDGLVYARQWKSDGASIWGATGVAYVPDYRDVGSMIGCAVRATNAGGSASADAAPIGPVTAAP